MKEKLRIAAINILLLLAVALAVGVPVLHQSCFRGCRLPIRLCCIANLRQIEGAKYSWMAENDKTTNDVPMDVEIFGPNLYVKAKPWCADGGIYTLGPVHERPKCSIPDHNVW